MILENHVCDWNNRQEHHRFMLLTQTPYSEVKIAPVLLVFNIVTEGKSTASAAVDHCALVSIPNIHNNTVWSRQSARYRENKN